MCRKRWWGTSTATAQGDRRAAQSGQSGAAPWRAQGAVKKDRCVPGSRMGHQHRGGGVASDQRHHGRQARQLHRLVSMLMGRLTAILFHVQGLVGVMVVVNFLCMHNHVNNHLLLVIKVHRRQPCQCLPDHSNQKVKGSALTAHQKIVLSVDLASFCPWQPGGQSARMFLCVKGDHSTAATPQHRNTPLHGTSGIRRATRAIRHCWHQAIAAFKNNSYQRLLDKR